MERTTILKILSLSIHKHRMSFHLSTSRISLSNILQLLAYKLYTILLTLFVNILSFEGNLKFRQTFYSHKSRNIRDVHQGSLQWNQFLEWKDQRIIQYLFLSKAWAKVSLSTHYYSMLSSELSPNRVMTGKKEVKPQENIKLNIF